MLKFRIRLAQALASGLLVAASAGALAQDDDESVNSDDPTYSAIRITAVETDFDNIDRAVNLGFTLGINIPGLNFLAAEIDLSGTLIPGENSGPAPLFGGGGGGDDGGLLGPILGGGDGGDGGGSSGSSRNLSQDGDDLQTQSVGLFAVARSPGRFFGEARLGYRFVQTTISDLDEDDTGSAWGVGLGYRYGQNGKVALTYTEYGSDVQYISLAISY